jgi:hypothetical protein
MQKISRFHVGTHRSHLCVTNCNIGWLKHKSIFYADRRLNRVKNTEKARAVLVKNKYLRLCVMAVLVTFNPQSR